MTEPDEPSAGAADRLDAINRRLRWLIVAMGTLVLAVGLNTAAIYGYLVEFHAGEGLLIGGASGSGVALGFVLGWLTRRAVG